MILTYEAFRKAHPATRCFHKYDSVTRADRASSFRLSRQARDRVGEHFYIHPLCPGVAFPTAKRATTHAYEAYLAAQPATEQETPCPSNP